MQQNLVSITKKQRFGVVETLIKSTTIIVFSLTSLACQNISSHERAYDMIPSKAMVLMEITAGTPSAPTETIEAKKQDSTYLLKVHRIQPLSEVVEQEQFEITREEFAQIWLIVAREKLISFQPAMVEEAQVIDFGEHRLRLEFIDSQSNQLREHEVSWTQPLKNEASVAALSSQLGQLARKYAKKVELFYFPSSLPST